MTILYVCSLENPAFTCYNEKFELDFERMTELLIEIEQKYSKDLSDFIQIMLQYSSEKRPDFISLNNKLNDNRNQIRQLQYGSVTI